jgi:hypothetical protein
MALSGVTGLVASHLRYADPQLEQLGELHEPQEEPCELENPPSLLWLQTERSFLTLVALQVGQQTS